ncbi:MAG: hypothetical protein ACLGHT_05270 [Acidimicrobiia bacterium]
MPADMPAREVTVRMEQIVDAPRQCIDGHGPINRQNLSSSNEWVRPVGRNE